MNEKEFLQNIERRVYDLLKNDASGHDFYHIQRVVNNTKQIARKENCNNFYAILLAYLHDVGDYKVHDGKDKTSYFVNNILGDFHFVKENIADIIQDINLIGYRGGFNKKPEKIEVQIVQDADRLDALGAIGIARAFAYGGKQGRLMHNPEFLGEKYSTAEEYERSQAPTIQHFYDKLLRLKDMMNTATGRELAEERHLFVEKFLEQFFKEWG